MQIDMMSQSMKPEEMVHVDMRKFVKAKFAVRDMTDLLVSQEEADRRQAQQDAAAAAQQKQQTEMVEAEIRKSLADAFKNIAQGQKNTAATQALQVDTALNVLVQGLGGEGKPAGPGEPANDDQGGSPQGGGGAASAPGDAGGDVPAGGPGLPPANPQGSAGGMPGPGLPPAPGAGPGL
jgi:hypothetical protein